MVINIKITDKRPSVEGAPVIVCGNSDYTIKFTFDAEWDAYSTKTVRFIWVENGKVRFKDVEMKGTTECNVPKLHSTNSVRIGVYAGDLHTTTRAVIPCEWSILCEGGKPATEDYQYYTNEAMDAAREAKDAANEAMDAAREAKDAANEAKDAAREAKDAASSAAASANEAGDSAGDAAVSAGEADTAAKNALRYYTESKAAASRAEKAAEEAENVVEEKGGALFSNALKGKKSGGIVAMSDISPVGHPLGVRVRGANVSAVKVKKLGKNLSMINGQELTGINIKTVIYKGYINTPLVLSWNQDCASTNGASMFGVKDANSSEWPQYIGDSRTSGAHSVVINPTNKEAEIQILNWAHCIGNINNIQLEAGTVATEYEPYIDTVEYAVNADGTVDGVTSIYPTTTLLTDTAGAVVDVEYNRDINKAFAELYNAIISLGGNV